MPSFWRSAYRLGAAVALNAMGLEGARQVLEDASQSPYPTVRRIVKKVMQDQPSSKEA